MSKLTQWTGKEDNRWSAVGATTNDLPPDNYIVQAGMMGPFLSAKKPIHDTALLIEDGASEHIIKSVVRFRSKKADFDRFKLLHKRGLLLTGAPGTGKTMSCMLAAENVVANGGIVVSPASTSHFIYLSTILNSIREVHPQMLILCILEDLHDHPYQENIHRLLSLLDGGDQVGNIFFLGTTNYIEELDDRLTNRPKRFDEVIVIGPPSEKARKSYLAKAMPADQPNRDKMIDELAKASEGLLLAHLGELMISVCVLEHSIKDAAKRLKNMNEEAIKRAQAEANIVDSILAGAPRQNKGEVAARRR